MMDKDVVDCEVVKDILDDNKVAKQNLDEKAEKHSLDEEKVEKHRLDEDKVEKHRLIENEVIKHILDVSNDKQLIFEENKIETTEVGIQTEKPFIWDSLAELHLLHAMNGMKLVGPVINFMILAVHERFCEAMGVNISIEEVKNKLSTFYDFEAANRLLFQAPPREEFSLPPDEFDLPELIKPKAAAPSPEEKVPPPPQERKKLVGVRRTKKVLEKTQ